MSKNEKTSTEVMKEKFENKELGTEQLENVSGGGDKDVQYDSYFLNYMFGNDVCERWPNKPRDYGDNGDEEAYEQVRNGWKKVGIVCECDCSFAGFNVPNKYFIDGKEISRKQAFEHAQKVLGKKVTDSDWMPWR
ncbi:MAG: hypothetical protein IKZ66_01420 [Schwartzia sp.]|nr:hypothetical protein [Schwartzia sp. (in: firmicutes)]